MRIGFGANRDGVIRIPTSVKLVSEESTRALQAAWLRKRNELGDWSPSGGWLVQPVGYSQNEASVNSSKQ
jgi:hypothetical protein